MWLFSVIISKTVERCWQNANRIMSFPLCWTIDQLKDEIREKFAYTCDPWYIATLQTTNVTLSLPGHCTCDFSNIRRPEIRFVQLYQTKKFRSYVWGPRCIILDWKLFKRAWVLKRNIVSQKARKSDWNFFRCVLGRAITRSFPSSRARVDWGKNKP